MNENFAAVILGGTGQVGGAAVKELLAIPECREAVMVPRKPIAAGARAANGRRARAAVWVSVPGRRAGAKKNCNDWKSAWSARLRGAATTPESPSFACSL